MQLNFLLIRCENSYLLTLLVACFCFSVGESLLVMDRRPSRFSSGRDQEDYSDRRNSRQRNFGRERSPPERGRPSPPPIRGRSPGGRGRASPGRARSPPGRDRSPLRNRSPFRGGSAGGYGPLFVDFVVVCISETVDQGR